MAQPCICLYQVAVTLLHLEIFQLALQPTELLFLLRWKGISRNTGKFLRISCPDPKDFPSSWIEHRIPLLNFPRFWKIYLFTYKNFFCVCVCVKFVTLKRFNFTYEEKQVGAKGGKPIAQRLNQMNTFKNTLLLEFQISILTSLRDL